MSYITRAQARFALDTFPAQRLRQAATTVSDQLESLLDQRLLELYGFLALTTGTDTTREDVHDAWAVWKEQIDPAHRSLIPFEELTPDVQALDQPYVDAIHRAAVALSSGGGNGLEKLAGTVVGRAKDTSLEAARFRLPDGREKEVAIVHRPAAVAVVPLRVGEDGGVEVLLVRQPRPAVGEAALVEIVAGKVDGDDDPLETAQRELGEEAGLQAEVWHGLAASLLPAPGFLDEPIHLFAAHGLSAVPSREEDTHITGEWIPLTDAVRMVLAGEIRDMKARDALLVVDKLHHDWLLV